jgi:hypothetical protein
MVESVGTHYNTIVQTAITKADQKQAQIDAIPIDNKELTKRLTELENRINIEGRINDLDTKLRALIQHESNRIENNLKPDITDLDIKLRHESAESRAKELNLEVKINRLNNRLNNKNKASKEKSLRAGQSSSDEQERAGQS